MVAGGHQGAQQQERCVTATPRLITGATSAAASKRGTTRPHRYAIYTIGVVCVLVALVLKRCLLLGSFLTAVLSDRNCFKTTYSGVDASSRTAGTTTTTTTRSATSAREMVGTWMGKSTWIPPHPWRYFDAAELRQMYQNKNVLWIGDSTGRRAFATMYAILDDKNEKKHISSLAISDPSVIDVNKHEKVESCNKTFANVPAHRHPALCRPAPSSSSNGDGTTGEFSYIIGTCFDSVELVLQSELDGTTNLTAQVDVIILSLGIWEVLERQTCNQVDIQQRTPMHRLDHALDLAARFTQKTGKTILWRTSGYGGFRWTIKGVDLYNHRIMTAIDEYNNSTRIATTTTSNTSNFSNNRLVYVNWGDAVAPRSFGPDKLAGDIPAHYSEEARVVLVQMTTNRLQEIGFFNNQ